MAGVIVFIGDRAVAGDGGPQAGELRPFDGPEEAETDLVDEGDGLLRVCQTALGGAAIGPVAPAAQLA